MTDLQMTEKARRRCGLLACAAVAAFGLVACAESAPEPAKAHATQVDGRAAQVAPKPAAAVKAKADLPAAAPKAAKAAKAKPAARVAVVEPDYTAPAWRGEATPLVAIPEGRHRPFFPGKDEAERVTVPAFQIERTPVTVAQLRAFLGKEPQWRRSRIAPLFADAGYLRGWRGDLAPPADNRGKVVPANTVATHISWFVARAYCEHHGRRLPRLAEWERVAVASATSEDGRKEKGFSARILRWYSHPARGRPGPVGTQPPNKLGVRDLHGLVWEWVDDFNTALITGESRADAALDRGLYCGAGSIGAADPSDYAAFMRFAMRSSLSAKYTTGSLGFRCAADPREGSAP